MLWQIITKSYYWNNLLKTSIKLLDLRKTNDVKQIKISSKTYYAMTFSIKDNNKNKSSMKILQDHTNIV